MRGIEPKLEYLLNNWFFAKGVNHEIRLMFKEHDIIDSEELVTYDKQFIVDLGRQKNNVSTPLNKRKIKMILHVILYYKFMCRNKNKAIAKDPT